jgi:hypothetical protein
MISPTADGGRLSDDAASALGHEPTIPASASETTWLGPTSRKSRRRRARRCRAARRQRTEREGNGGSSRRGQGPGIALWLSFRLRRQVSPHWASRVLRERSLVISCARRTRRSPRFISWVLCRAARGSGGRGAKIPACCDTAGSSRGPAARRSSQPVDDVLPVSTERAARYRSPIHRSSKRSAAQWSLSSEQGAACDDRRHC